MLLSKLSYKFNLYISSNVLDYYPLSEGVFGNRKPLSIKERKKRKKKKKEKKERKKRKKKKKQKK